MSNKTPVTHKLTLTAAFVASALSFSAAADNQISAVQAELNAVKNKVTAPYEKTTNTNLQEFPTYYIVQLHDEPLATYKGGVNGIPATHRVSNNQGKLDTQSKAAQDYKSYLTAQQNEVFGTLSQKFPSLQQERSLNTVLNGFIVSHAGNVDIKAELEAMPGVKKVYEHELYYAQTDASLDLIGAPEVWSLIDGADGRAKAGEGIKVAIIDTGINSGHPLFDGAGHTRPEGLPTDDYCSTIDATFCNDKLVLARYYTPTFQVHSQEYISPFDLNGHGSHVAGTAAGNIATTQYSGVDVTVSGVAPGASIMVYKALFTVPSGQGSGSNIMLAQALEDAVSDGADVVNNSWGGGPGGNPANSLYTPIFEAAEEAGVLMVTAAGNDGPGAGTVGCPGCAEPGLTVANTQTGRFFAEYSVTGSGLEGEAAFIGNSEGGFTWPTDPEDEDAPLIPITATYSFAGSVDEENFEGCAPFEADAFKDQIAVIPRGTCAFSDKAINAANAGAIALIVPNNEAGVINMSMPGATIPSVSISQAAGKVLAENWTEDAEITIAPDAISFIDDSLIDVMSASSSRGPNGDTAFLKPDLAAPGTNILSAYSSVVDPAYAAISGTSMASPHVAGAAALVRQLNPELNAVQVKSILTTSTDSGVKKEDAATPATPFDRGAGRLNVAKAVNSALAFDKATLASNGCIISCEFERTVTNLAGDGEWSGSVSFTSAGVQGELNQTSLEFVADEETGELTASFELAIDVTYAQEGWIFGEVLWTDSTGKYADARLPIAVWASHSPNPQVLATAVVDAANLTSGPATIQAHLGDSSSDLPVSFIAQIPEGTTLVKDSVNVVTNRANQLGYSVSPNGKAISWAGTVKDQASTYTLTNSFAYNGLSVFSFNASQIDCSDTCDESNVSLNLASVGGFYLDGEYYTSIRFSDNGLAWVSGHQGTTFNNQPLPSSEQPNGVLAPFWSDFVVGGQQGGRMGYGLLSDGVYDWLVIEWDNVAKYDDPNGERYSFAIWIALDTDIIAFNYLDMPSNPGTGTVGFEDGTGTKGYTAYHNGQGSVPFNGAEVVLQQGDKGFVNISYDVKPEKFGQAASSSHDVVEGDSIDIDLSKAFELGLTTHSEVKLVQDNTTYRAVSPFKFKAEGTPVLVITSQPENGTLVGFVEEEEEEEADVDVNATEAETPVEVEIDGYVVTYTPNEDFYGEDSFTYKVVDANGEGTAETTVTVNVVRKNVAPVASATGQGTYKNGETVKLDASASSDADGDTLTYSWEQTSGPSVNLSGASSAVASFVAPEVSENTSFAFKVTVSDGDLSDTATVSVTVEKKKKSKSWYKGSFGVFASLLVLPLVFVRRRRKLLA